MSHLFVFFLCQTFYKLSQGYIVSDCGETGGRCLQAATTCDGWVDDYGIGCGKKSVCCRSPLHQYPLPPDSQVLDCGLVTRLPADHLIKRVVNGRTSLEGQWPWQVALSTENRGLFCGGSLIHSSWILTAAHCVSVLEDVTALNITLGNHHRIYNSGNEVYRKPARIVLHPDFEANTETPNDIALVRLDSAVSVSGHYTRTVCLPEEDAVFDDTDQCFASGWGYTAGSADSRVMNYVRVPIITTRLCNASWSGRILDTQLCGGDGRSGVCQGDSGGPLVCLRNNRYVQAGVISWGYMFCGQHGFPDVFTKVTSYTEWIKKIIENN